jgi:hypothetical protein
MLFSLLEVLTIEINVTFPSIDVNNEHRWENYHVSYEIKKLYF